MGDLSPNFSLAEFDTCGDECTGTVVDPELVCLLEALRSLCGDRPLRIISGYRCHPCNRRVGGASRSQHLSGKAADIPRGYATVEQAEAVGFGGIGSSGPWATHVDVRAWPARWSYD